MVKTLLSAKKGRLIPALLRLTAKTMNGLYKIEKNLCITTADKRKNETVCIEGHYWIEPTEDVNVKDMFGRLEDFIAPYLPNEYIFCPELPERIGRGRRSNFTFQIHLLTHTSEKFTDYCKRTVPLILEKKPQFLKIISDCGFSVHLTKKG